MVAIILNDKLTNYASGLCMSKSKNQERFFFIDFFVNSTTEFFYDKCMNMKVPRNIGGYWKNNTYKMQLCT